MHLEKLKIFGFKSFAKKTEIKLLPGITAIVGPNGCGKSNVVDAIRWVLGEQKAGTLRSDRMESVIFNGSKNLKALGMSEVSLVIQNSDNVLPIEYSEVVLTRRLFRSGESQYLLNNNPCRLKDINDLLMDTGLAPDAYSVIELSMVEQILSGKPEDRRRIFEEAVGLTKYKQRRKLTFRKLDATEQDLTRLADIIGEVRSKVNSLHRQVRRAQRYQTLSEKLSESEIRVATHSFSQIYDELGPLNEKFEESTRSRESLSSQISFKEAEIETIQTDLIQVEDQQRSSQSKLNETNATIQKREEEILLSRERLKSLAENKTRIYNEIEMLEQRITIRKEQLEETQQQKSSTTEEITKFQQEYEKEKLILDDFDKQINEKKILAREADQAVLELMQSISEQQKNMERLKAQLDNLETRNNTIIEEKENLLQKIDSDEEAAKELRKTLTNLQARQEGLTETQSELEIQSESLQQEIENLKNDILHKNNQIESVQQRIAFLKDLLESYADYPEGVKYLMVNQGTEKGFQSAFADILKVENEHRKAIEAALGDSAAYLLVSDEQTAYLGVNTLKETKQGVVTFLPVDKLSPKNKQINLGKEPGVIGWANEIIECESKYRAAAQILLGSYLVVEDLSTAQKLTPKIRDHNVQIVTKAGEIIFNWGAIRGGKKETESESLIGRQDQLKKLKEKNEKLYTELEKAENLLKDKEIARVENSRKKADVAQLVKNLQEDITKNQVEISQADYRIQQAKGRISNFDEELKQVSVNMGNIQDQIGEIEPDLQQYSEKHAAMNDEVKSHQIEMEEQEQKRTNQADKVNHLNLKIVEITGNERSLDQAFEQTENLIREHETTIENRQKDLIDNENQKEQLEGRIDELGETLSGDYSVKEKFETDVETFTEKTKAIRENVEKRNKETNILRKEREAVADTLHHAELRISELRIKADNLYRKMADEYDWELKREKVDPDYDNTVDEAEIEKIRERIKRLGPVNLLALKEYEKEKERLDFLETQQEDLITAEQNLKETIEHINKTAQEKFDSLFNEIRLNFIKVFKGFFQNGEADLVIEDNGDPLEANIEIKASPKGKRMESLTLLSGGEKALTAISLLFGIYLVKPSPVCILDEVDAPLDDNNVKRFINALNQFSGSTQFLMVTHNKITMKSAGALYGITMEESGVSKVVSVKLE
ncbi:chromosome segregation protein SMC [candidate division KSB1 bacterium]|nr:chromosome segregation protein SMC [candidate division KSB1 bacterium]